MEIKTLFKT